MKNLMLRFVREEEGQDLIEYGLLAAFISIVAILAIGRIGGAVNTIYGNVATAVESAPS